MSHKIFLILICIVFVIVLANVYSTKEGFYNNQTNYYPGCNPLLYTQCTGCKTDGSTCCGAAFPTGCGFKGQCTREADLCSMDRGCPLANKIKSRY